MQPKSLATGFVAAPHTSCFLQPETLFGLLEFIDLGGLDILYYADRFLYAAYKSERFKAPNFIEEKMKRGETGPRAGKGIYEYGDGNTKALFEKKYRDLIKVLNAMPKDRSGGHS